jgi:single-strand DNA-binding protein
MSTPAFVSGNITSTPQLTHTSDGTRVVNLSPRREHPPARRRRMGRRHDHHWEVVCFGPQAENIAASLPCGARAIAVGTFRTRTWHGDDGGERSRLEIVAFEVRPSLRWATAQITNTAAKG